MIMVAYVVRIHTISSIHSMRTVIVLAEVLTSSHFLEAICRQREEHLSPPKTKRATFVAGDCIEPALPNIAQRLLQIILHWATLRCHSKRLLIRGSLEPLDHCQAGCGQNSLWNGLADARRDSIHDISAAPGLSSEM